MQRNLTYIPITDEWIYQGQAYTVPELFDVLGIDKDHKALLLTIQERPEAIDVALIW